ncbi:MAG: polyprenyl synthetase family protein [Armatimonadota bacterium]
MDDRLTSLFAGEYATLYNASTAMIGSRGKRLRPLVLLLSCACFGDVDQRALTSAAMVELIHTASLAHDDVVDEADSRRGAPSAPARWGNKFSVLLGDYLFARVFELATEDGDPVVQHLLATTATNMGRAIILEFSGPGLVATEDTYWQVIRGKTAALFATSTAIGARVGGANDAQQAVMEQMGEAFGFAFQLADDLMDLQGSEDEVGKPLGVDWQQRRATLPLIHVLRTAPDAVAEEIRILWQQDPFTHEHLTALRCLVEAHGGFDYSWEKVKDYQEQARGCLSGIPASPARDALLRLCVEAFPLPVMPATA